MINIDKIEYDSSSMAGKLTCKKHTLTTYIINFNLWFHL